MHTTELDLIPAPDVTVLPPPRGPFLAPEDWAREFGRIPDRVTREAIPFHPSELQLRMFRHYSHCESLQIPCRMVVPKTRRGGGSTGAAALLYLHAHRYQARLGEVGTDEAVSMNMYGMMRFFAQHDSCPAHEAPSKKLARGYLEWPYGSTWETYSAENPEGARSAGLQGYHATEVGRWYDSGAKDGRETLRSMLGAVPRRGFTVAIEESTARGAQGPFYERFLSARWPTAEELGVPEGREYWRTWSLETPQNVPALASERSLQFVRVFAAWFEDEENRTHGELSPDDFERLQATLDEKELDLIRRYKSNGPKGERLGTVVTEAILWEQLAWRRAVIATEFDGDVEGFQQENPSSPREAFASRGRHTFNRAGCAWLTEQSRSLVPQLGVLTEQDNGGVLFCRTDTEEAWFQLWQEPRGGLSYLCGVDTCGGRTNVRDPEETDYNAALVLRTSYRDDEGRKVPHTVVASLKAKDQSDPDQLVERVRLMARYFGNCFIVFEVNNTGQAFRDGALARGDMVLYKEKFFDREAQAEKQIVGWTTTAKTRPILIGTLKKHLRHNAVAESRPDGLVCWSPIVAQECTDLMPNNKGVDCAPGNKHDDHVMALGLALQGVESATTYPIRRRRHQQPTDRENWLPVRNPHALQRH